MPPWLEAQDMSSKETPASVDLEVTLEHVLGLNLESLSASQLDVVWQPWLMGSYLHRPIDSKTNHRTTRREYDGTS